jgi:mono/diheme cytochrome c family protein
MTQPIHHLLLTTAALGLVACTGAVPNVTPADTHWATQNWPDATQAQLEQGRSLYVGHCGGCHAIVPPEKHSGDQWRAQLTEMAPRAKLQGLDRERVLRYLLTVSRQTAQQRRDAAAPP